MSAYWEIHEKIVETHKICRVFPRRALGVDLGSISGGFGCPKSGEGDPETLTNNDWKKVWKDFSSNGGPRGGRPLKLVNSILQRTLIDPLSLHFVPQGHGGGYIFIRTYIYIAVP